MFRSRLNVTRARLACGAYRGYMLPLCSLTTASVCGAGVHGGTCCWGVDALAVDAVGLCRAGGIFSHCTRHLQLVHHELGS